MAIFFPPTPPVPTGGAQPYGQKKLTPKIIGIPVDDPPFNYGGPFASTAEIVSINQPNPWVYTYFGAFQPFTPRKLNPAITAVPEDNPPFNYGGPYSTKAEIVSINQPNPWVYTYFGSLQPFEPKKLSPGIPGQSVDRPPVSSPGRSAITAEIVSINQPNPWVYLYHGGRQPFSPRTLTPSIINVPSDNPPFNQRQAQLFAELISLNQPPVWNYTFIGWNGPYMPEPVPSSIEANTGFYRVYIIF